MDHVVIGVFENGDNFVHGLNRNWEYDCDTVGLFIDRKIEMEKVNKMVNGTAKAYFTLADIHTFPILMREMMGIYRCVYDLARRCL